MDKMILLAGLVVLSLGVGFLLIPAVDSSLHSAYTSGGYLWLILGGATIGFGLKVRREQEKQLGALRHL